MDTRATPPLDPIDARLVDHLHGGFPLSPRPFAEVGETLGLGEDEVISRLARLRADGVLTRFGPLFDTEKLGGAVSLAAMAVPAERFEAVAALVNAFAEVAHNYEREHAFNMWFVLAAESDERLDDVAAAIGDATGLDVFLLPKEREYFLELRLRP
jgi:DNA-binding Lrp family transcriptional regulator